MQRVCRTSFHQLRQLSVIRSSLSMKTCTALVHAFVTSRLDYCNSLLSGINKELLNRLESVLRSAARLVMRKRKFDPISEDIRNILHWLPVRQRIEFKLGILTFKCLHGDAPSYLTESLSKVAVNPALQAHRSATRGDLWCLELEQLKWARGVFVSRAQCSGTRFRWKFVIMNKPWNRSNQN